MHDFIDERDRAFVESCVERSRFVPHAQRETPVPDWKRTDWASDVLPEGDPARD